MTFDARRIDSRVRLAMRILEFEQTAVPSLKALSDRVGISPFRLAHLFSEQLGESIVAYGRRVRLDSSNHQMTHDDVPLEGVAAAFGYRSQAAFTRAYTRQFGMSPRQFVSTVLGRTHRDYAAGYLEPVGGVDPVRSIGGNVHLRERPSQPALARRFYGYDIASHWRTFLSDLPAGLAEAGTLACMGYDNVRVTPERHWRMDCAVVFDTPRATPWTLAGTEGLDPVELPGGLHAELSLGGGFPALWRGSIELLTEWLPARPDYAPEGDPVVTWLEGPPQMEPDRGTTTIRIRQRGTSPAYNLPPLTRHGRKVGKRTDPGER